MGTEFSRCGARFLAVFSFLCVFLPFFGPLLFPAPLLSAPLVSAPESRFTILREGKNILSGIPLDFLEDAKGVLSWKEVAHGNASRLFRPTPFTVPNFGFTNKVYWLRFTLVNRSRRSLWYLRINYPPLDNVNLHYGEISGKNAGKMTRLLSGDARPFAIRAVKNRTPIFPLELKENGTYAIYLRVQTQGTMQVPLSLYRPEAFHSQDHNEQILLGIYYGIFMVLALYNLILFFLVREKVYLFYLLYITGYGIFQMNLNGISFEYLWPSFPEWNNISLPLSIGWAFFWGALFASELLDTRRNSPRLHYYLLFLGSLLFIYLVISLFPDSVSYYHRINIGAGLIIVFGFSVLFSGVRVALLGFRPARFFLIAWLAFIAGMVLYALKAFGVIPATLITENSMQLGSALEMSLLSLGIGERINIINRQKEESRRREEQAELRAVRHQVELLKKSIQPHFLMNSLNATTVWLREDPDAAARLIHNLALELRMILRFAGENLIPIADEIKLCESHLEVMSLRRDGKFRLHVKGLSGNEKIPPMIFHTLIENGLSHGYRDREEGVFRLVKWKTESGWRFLLFNDGSPIDRADAPSLGYGLRYIRARLEERWPGCWKLQSGPFRGGWGTLIEIQAESLD